MKTRSYRLTPAARDDMNAIVDYLRERNPVAAIRFVEAAQATFEHICQASSAYPRLGWGGPRLAFLRWRPLTGAFNRYLVFYHEGDDYFDVVRVLHSARNIERILRDEE
ncbi:type II toxin-antitoxin system RelE/ParE family toxin [Enhygromyxa salina]|uniref:type II toxin-antitoxin system RelE/ParE family toxin n=1 Tax=Enhygromyxa salina TaxID=215803 RepID=UPI0004E7B021|nr:type II toxin-antitoxin system RelE/ParE family toxin [Enhygromyxa salina]